MKRCIAVLMLIGLTQVASAQIMTEGFETWDSVDGRVRPRGWVTDMIGVGKTDTAHTGEYAVSVWNWYSHVAGRMVTSTYPYALFEFERAGVPIGYKPARLTGYYRYELRSNGGKSDSGLINILLKRYNASRGMSDTVGLAEKRLGPAGVYTPFTVEISDLAPGVDPDSIVIVVASSVDAVCEEATCCYLSLDDLALTTASGVSYDADRLFEAVEVYPNPVRSLARIEWESSSTRPHRLLIYSLDGRLVRSIDGLTGSSATIDRSGLAAGEYLFEVRDESGGAVRRGRFIVD